MDGTERPPDVDDFGCGPVNITEAQSSADITPMVIKRRGLAVTDPSSRAVERRIGWWMIAIAAIGLSSIVGGAAVACSPNLRIMNSVAESLKSSNVVALAYLESIDSRPISDGEYKGGTRENARFLVLETWKGRFAPGTHIETATTIWNGNCGISAVNNPRWIVDKNQQAVPVSRVWLLYLDGKEPFKLTMGLRTSPLNIQGADDLPELYRLTRVERGQ